MSSTLAISQFLACDTPQAWLEAALNNQDILLALKENVIHWRSKPEDPSTESNPHRFGLPTDNSHRHHQKKEAAPHLHIGDNKSKA